MRNILLGCVLFLTACGSPSNPPAAGNSIQPFHTSTLEDIDTPNVIFADTPLPTSTLIAYVIQEGDTISELAEKFNVSQDDLRAVNPEINPNSMTIGATILIPDSSSSIAAASTPTPVPLPITQAVCHPTPDGGQWCFALVHNDTSDLLENVSVQITLVDQNSVVIASQTAFLPLDILPPNSSLPAYIFFPNASANSIPQVQLLSALQLNTGSSRYLPVSFDNTLAQIDRGGHIAQLSGQVYLPAESKAATQVWIAAVAYDGVGRVIGVRRWEGGAIEPGRSVTFNFSIAGIGSSIDSVDFVVQAK